MVVRPVRTLFMLAALPLWSGCGGGGSSAPAPETGLDAPDRTVAVQAAPVYTVGGFDAPDWASFGDTRQVAFDDRGHLFILDTQANQVTEVDTEGQFVRTIGGPGEGPGELSSPFGFAFTPDGGLAIFDIGHQGWVTYDANGEFVGNVRVDMAEIGLPGNRLSRHPDGGVVGAVGGRIRMGPASPAEGESDNAAPSRPVVYFALSESDSSRVVYNAWDMPETPEGEEANLSTSGGGSFQIRMPILRAFEPVLRASALPDGRVAVVDSIGYRVKLVDASGAVAGVLERPIAPTPVTGGIEDAERQRRIDELEEQGGGTTTVIAIGGGGMTQSASGGMSDMMRNRVETMIFAEEIPVIEDMAVDPTGRIWVQRSSGEPGVDGPTDLITAEGTYLGTLPADGLRIPQAFGPDGLIVRRVLDEFDVATLIVERLPAEIG
jgi:hypothetical protein